MDFPTLEAEMSSFVNCDWFHENRSQVSQQQSKLIINDQNNNS